MLEVAHDDRQKKIRTIADILHEETDKLHRLSISKTALTGTPSGFKDLDEKTGGFQPGNLIVLAARPSMGKSALVCNMAENAVARRPCGGAVLAGDVRVRARPALRRLPGADQGRGPAPRPGRRVTLAEDPGGLPAPGRRADVRR